MLSLLIVLLLKFRYGIAHDFRHVGSHFVDNFVAAVDIRE